MGILDAIKKKIDEHKELAEIKKESDAELKVLEFELKKKELLAKREILKAEAQENMEKRVKDFSEAPQKKIERKEALMNKIKSIGSNITTNVKGDEPVNKKQAVKSSVSKIKELANNGQQQAYDVFGANNINYNAYEDLSRSSEPNRRVVVTKRVKKKKVRGKKRAIKRSIVLSENVNPNGFDSFSHQPLNVDKAFKDVGGWNGGKFPKI